MFKDDWYQVNLMETIPTTWLNPMILKDGLCDINLAMSSRYLIASLIHLQHKNKPWFCLHSQQVYYSPHNPLQSPSVRLGGSFGILHSPGGAVKSTASRIYNYIQKALDDGMCLPSTQSLSAATQATGTHCKQWVRRTGNRPN